MKNKGFKILFWISIILVLADLVSTLKCGKLVEYLESNPLYKYGGLTLILFINILVLSYFWWVYNKKKINITERYFVILAMCFISVIRLFAIYGNIHVAYAEPMEIAQEQGITYDEAKELQLEYAKNVTNAEKNKFLLDLIVPYLLPYICTIFAWLIFKLDHKIEVLE